METAKNAPNHHAHVNNSKACCPEDRETRIASNTRARRAHSCQTPETNVASESGCTSSIRTEMPALQTNETCTTHPFSPIGSFTPHNTACLLNRQCSIDSQTYLCHHGAELSRGQVNEIAFKSISFRKQRAGLPPKSDTTKRPLLDRPLCLALSERKAPKAQTSSEAGEPQVPVSVAGC